MDCFQNSYKKISILIPVYNEFHTIESCLERVLKADVGNLEMEVIISEPPRTRSLTGTSLTWTSDVEPHRSAPSGVSKEPWARE